MDLSDSFRSVSSTNAPIASTSKIPYHNLISTSPSGNDSLTDSEDLEVERSLLNSPSFTSNLATMLTTTTATNNTIKSKTLPVNNKLLELQERFKDWKRPSYTDTQPTLETTQYNLSYPNFIRRLTDSNNELVFTRDTFLKMLEELGSVCSAIFTPGTPLLQQEHKTLLFNYAEVTWPCLGLCSENVIRDSTGAVISKARWKAVEACLCSIKRVGMARLAAAREKAASDVLSPNAIRSALLNNADKLQSASIASQDKGKERQLNSSNHTIFRKSTPSPSSQSSSTNSSVSPFIHPVVLLHELQATMETKDAMIDKLNRELVSTKAKHVRENTRSIKLLNSQSETIAKLKSLLVLKSASTSHSNSLLATTLPSSSLLATTKPLHTTSSSTSTSFEENMLRIENKELKYSLGCRNEEIKLLRAQVEHDRLSKKGKVSPVESLPSTNSLVATASRKLSTSPSSSSSSSTSSLSPTSPPHLSGPSMPLNQPVTTQQSNMASSSFYSTDSSSSSNERDEPARKRMKLEVESEKREPISIKQKQVSVGSKVRSDHYGKYDAAIARLFDEDLWDF